MNLLRRLITTFILASLYLLAVAGTAPAQATNGEEQSQTDDASSRAEAALLQKKANEAQSRIRGNEADRDQLMRAVKLNEVGLAKEVLLRNGFTAKDLEDAKITLLTGGGKGGEDGVTISATCCDPKVITIQRTVENFTK
jgi:hypothetical protein